MNQVINFVAIDVDDKAFHGYVGNEDDQKGHAFHCRPVVGQLVKKIKELSKPGYHIQVCYEATYIGFSLY